jgi:hypothetical protein
MDITTSFIRIIVLFEENIKYGNNAKSWGSVGTKAEPLSAEFCNFVQCDIFADYLNC